MAPCSTDSILPAAVKIGYLTFRVTDDPATLPAGVRGQIKFDVDTISVTRSDTPDRQRATFLHEVLHGVAEVAGFKGPATGEDAPTWDEEEWVTRLTPGLYQFFRENPAAVAYLLAGLS